MAYLDDILREYGVASARPAARAATHMPTPEEEETYEGLGSSALSALQYIGGSLDKPGSAVRGLLAGRPDQLLNLIPFSDFMGLTETRNRTSGRDLLRQYGAIGGKDNWYNFAGGLALEIATDPLTFLGPLTSASKTAAGKAAARAGQFQHLSAAERVGGSLNKVMDKMAREAAALGNDTALNAFKQNISHTMKKMNLDEAGQAAFLEQPLAGMLNVGIPGMPSMQRQLGAGAAQGSRTMRAAEGVDALMDGLKRGKIPEAVPLVGGMSPGTIMSEAFSPSALGRKMSSSQAAVRSATPLIEETMNMWKSTQQDLYDTLRRHGISPEEATPMLERAGPIGDVTKLRDRIKDIEGNHGAQAELFADLWDLTPAAKAEVAPGLEKVFKLYDDMHKMQVNAGLEPTFFHGEYAAYSPLRSKILDETENVTRHIGQKDELQRAVNKSRYKDLDMPGGAAGVERALHDKVLRAINDRNAAAALSDIVSDEVMDNFFKHAQASGVDYTPIEFLGRWVDDGQKGRHYEMGVTDEAGVFTQIDHMPAPNLSEAQLKAAKKQIKDGVELSRDTLPKHRKSIDAVDEAINYANDTFLYKTPAAGAAARAMKGGFLEEAKKLLGPSVEDVNKAGVDLADHIHRSSGIDDLPTPAQVKESFNQQNPDFINQKTDKAAAKAARKAAPNKEAGKEAARQVMEAGKASRAERKAAMDAARDAINEAKASAKVVKDAMGQQAKNSKLLSQVEEYTAEKAMAALRKAAKADENFQLPKSLEQFGGSLDEIDGAIRAADAKLDHAKGIAEFNGSAPAKFAEDGAPFWNKEYRTVANAKIAHAAYMTRNARAATMAFAEDAVDAAEQIPGHISLPEAMREAGITGMNANRRIAEDLLSANKISPEVFENIANGIAEDGVNVLDQFTVPHGTMKDFEFLKKTAETPGALFPIINAIDVATNVTKAHFTITRPSFHGRNALTLIWQDFLSGGHKNVTGMYRAVKNKITLFTKDGVIEGSSDWAVFHGMDLTDEAATNVLRNRHVLHEVSAPHSGQITEKVGQASHRPPPLFQEQVPGTKRQSTLKGVFKKMKPDIPVGVSGSAKAKSYAHQITNPTALRGGATEAEQWIPIKVGEAAADFGETTGRSMTWLRKLEEGQSWAQASIETNAAHVDYKALTRVERDYLKRVMPWYTFNRRMIPWQLGEIAQNPGGIVAQTIRAAGTPEGFVPEQAVGGIPVGEEKDGMQKYVTLDLPHETINSLFKIEPTMLGTVQQTMMGHMAQGHPLLKGPAEVAFGKSTHRGGQELSSMRGPLTPLNPSNEDWRPGGTVVSSIIGNSPVMPYLTQLKSIRDDRKSVLERGINLLTGISSHDVDVAASEARAKGKHAREKLKEQGWREFSRLYNNSEVPLTEEQKLLVAAEKMVGKRRASL